MKSRIAIFSGYKSPFAGRPSLGRPFRSVACLPSGRGLSDLGRRGYYVPPRDAWDEIRPSLPRDAVRYIQREAPGREFTRHPSRAGYKVKARSDTPAMKRAQGRMKRAAKTCSRKTKNSRGSFTTCMRRELKKKSKR